jgi:uncharacterized protein YggL (DUF469 family)
MEHKGVARVAFVAIVIVLVVGAVSIAYIMDLTYSGTSTNTMSVETPLTVKNLNDIFGNFSELSFRVSFQEPTQSNSTFAATYNFNAEVINRNSLSNGEHTTVVNITQASFSSTLSETSRTSAIIYLAQNGTALTATIDGRNTTSALANAYLFVFESSFNDSSATIQSALQNPATTSLTYEGSSNSQEFGNLTMQILTFRGANTTISAGDLPNSKFSIASYISTQVKVNGTVEPWSYQLMAATQT